jgi:hypothetical protein
MDQEELQEEFSVEFQIMPQALQFNMIDDKDIELIIDGVKTTIQHVSEIVMTSNKAQHQELLYFPFGKHTDRSRATMIINIQYRRDAAFLGERVIVRQG